jgi:hypothetical protein
MRMSTIVGRYSMKWLSLSILTSDDRKTCSRHQKLLLIGQMKQRKFYGNICLSDGLKLGRLKDLLGTI